MEQICIFQKQVKDTQNLLKQTLALSCSERLISCLPGVSGGVWAGDVVRVADVYKYNSVHISTIQWIDKSCVC